MAGVGEGAGNAQYLFANIVASRCGVGWASYNSVDQSILYFDLHLLSLTSIFRNILACTLT